MNNFQIIFNQQQLSAPQNLTYKVGTISGCSIVVNNKSPYAVNVFIGSNQVDMIDPYSYAQLPMSNDYVLTVNSDVSTTMTSDYMFVSLKILQNSNSQNNNQYTKGSTQYTGTMNANIVNSQINANVTNSNFDVNVLNSSLDANITNTNLDVNVLNSSLDANITNSELSVNVNNAEINASITNSELVTNVNNPVLKQNSLVAFSPISQAFDLAAGASASFTASTPNQIPIYADGLFFSVSGTSGGALQFSLASGEGTSYNGTPTPYSLRLTQSPAAANQTYAEGYLANPSTFNEVEFTITNTGSATVTGSATINVYGFRSGAGSLELANPSAEYKWDAYTQSYLHTILPYATNIVANGTYTTSQYVQVDLYNLKGIMVYLHVTTPPATGSMDFKLLLDETPSGYSPIVYTSQAITTAGDYMFWVYPNQMVIPSNAQYNGLTESVVLALPRQINLGIEQTAGTSTTYACDVFYLQ